MAFYEPDRYFSRISAINIKQDILGKGFTHVLMDVDNTLLTRDEHTVPHDVLVWLAQMREMGVEMCLLSNNFHQSVYHIADQLELPIVAKALKPLPQGFFMARHKIHGTRKNTLMIGDQLITDIMGAHLAGMSAYLVCPLVDVDLKHTLFVRNIENLFIADKEPEGAQACETLPS